MDQKEFIYHLQNAFSLNGLGHLLNEQNSVTVFNFCEILIETNKKFNLTAITDPKEMILKHFLDCASVLKLIPENSNLIDIGCGAGFPTFPIAILRPDIKVTSLDSTAKKINFINETAAMLSLDNIRGISGRAEDIVRTSRELYDVVISRAVARLNILDELCIPFLKVGGLFIAMKSSKGEEELTEATKGIKLLGADLKNKESLSLSYEESTVEREIFVFDKKSVTPAQYPRNYSQISKKPL